MRKTGVIRDVQMAFYLSRPEKKTLESVAKIEGMSQAALLRNLLLTRAREIGLHPSFNGNKQETQQAA
jgi:hypothetical protein